jgi:hypothetical protein
VAVVVVVVVVVAMAGVVEDAARHCMDLLFSHR